MKILFYRYGSICEPDILSAFFELGHEVVEMTHEITNKQLLPEESAKLVSDMLFQDAFQCVFSINFFPILSEVCNIFKIRYISWTVDSPVMEIFFKPIKNPWNRTFLFDREQFHEVHPFNPECIFHMPLAANPSHKKSIITNATLEDRHKFAHDVAFVGSLYTEKSPYDKLTGISEYLNGYLNSIMEAQKRIYGYFFIEDLLTDEMVEEFKAHLKGFYSYPLEHYLTDKKIMAQLYMGNKISAMERVDTFHEISKKHTVDLYTGSDTHDFTNIRNRGFAKSLTEMPLIFHESKINLNITSKPIRSGIPFRLFDILACGGFALTNYQPELTDNFTIGEDFDIYTDLNELNEKIQYYKEHEKKRKEIAACGLLTVEKYHTFVIRMQQILDIAFSC